MIPYLDLKKQYLALKSDIDLAIEAVINDSAFIGGKYVRAFEEAFAAYHGVKHCIGVGNGTDALEIILQGLDLPPGSEIIVPAYTFIATVEAVTRAGFKPVFCDIDPNSYTLCLKDLERRRTRSTSAIIAVHLYGHPCDMDGLRSFASTHSLRLIEDCAQAHGATFQGKKVGTFGVAAAFSFFPAKNLGAFGDAGAIITDNNDLALRCRMLANHGRVEKDQHEFEGRNSRLDGLQAAILAVKLKHLDAWVRRRREIAFSYIESLKVLAHIKLPHVDSRVAHAFHLFVLRTSRRDGLKKHLEGLGIQTQIHYPLSLLQQRAYRDHGLAEAKMFANQIGREVLSLPNGDQLQDKEVSQIVAGVLGFNDKI